MKGRSTKGRIVDVHIANSECPACKSYDHSMKLSAPSCNVTLGKKDYGMQLRVNCEICGNFRITEGALRKLNGVDSKNLRAKLATWLYHNKRNGEEVFIDLGGANANAYPLDKILSEVTLLDTEVVKYTFLIWFVKELKKRGGVHERLSASEIRINFIASEIAALRGSIVWAIKNALFPEGWISKNPEPILAKYTYSVTSKGLDVYKTVTEQPKKPRKIGFGK